MQHEEMTVVDRGSLRLWRVANILGWSLGALVVATALSFAMEILFIDVLDLVIDPFTGGAVVPGWIQLVITSAVIGGAIGAVVGSRLYRGAIAAAVVVTLVFVSVWPVAIVPVMVERNTGVAIAASVVLHVGAAVWGARFFYRRRIGRQSDPRTASAAQGASGD